MGGLAFSQLKTLYLTPVVYTYMAALLEKWRRMRTPRQVHWMNISGDLPDVSTQTIVVDPGAIPNTLYIGTDS